MVTDTGLAADPGSLPGRETKGYQVKVKSCELLLYIEALGVPRLIAGHPAYRSPVLLFERTGAATWSCLRGTNYFRPDSPRPHRCLAKRNSKK